MARGESTETLELRWKRVGFVLFSVAGIAGLTIGYSLQRRAHDALGIEIKAMEKQTEWAKTSVQEWREKLARQQRREPIVRQMAEMHLDLTNIVPSQRRVVPLLPRPSLAATAKPESALSPVSAISGSPSVSLGPLSGAANLNVRTQR